MILNALEGRPLPVYGDGMQVRDWLYVEDHVDALLKILDRGKPGETYCIGGNSERSNIAVVNLVCAILDDVFPESSNTPHNQLIQHVTDRLGHDRRYAIDGTKVEQELEWVSQTDFESGLRNTVRWLIENRNWVTATLDGARDKMNSVQI